MFQPPATPDHGPLRQVRPSHLRAMYDPDPGGHAMPRVCSTQAPPAVRRRRPSLVTLRRRRIGRQRPVLAPAQLRVVSELLRCYRSRFRRGGCHVTARKTTHQSAAGSRSCLRGRRRLHHRALCAFCAPGRAFLGSLGQFQRDTSSAPCLIHCRCEAPMSKQ
jgi:hypothetical protein